MKRFLRYILITATALCLTQAFALAADPVSVQLDGDAVRFTDAEPQIVSDRTFLPVRAVFEAMGAEVGYDNGVVTAVRGGRTVTMTIGSTAATVEEDGKTTELTMDVAPFIDPAVDRTYVPVRFAAQALGANVGWDADKRTVVIVDTEKEIDAVLEGKSFTYLDKYLAYSRKYNTGLWNSEVSCKGSIDINVNTLGLGGAPLSIPMTVTARGATQDSTRMDVTETIRLDLSSAKPLIASLISADSDAENGDAAAAAAESEKALDETVKALNDRGITFLMRGDLPAGKFYMNFDLSALGEDAVKASGFDKDSWYVMDFPAAGLDLTELMAQTQSMKFRDILAAVLASADVNSADTGYAELDKNAKAIVDALSDSGFTKNGDVYSTSFTLPVEGMQIKLALSLTMKNDAVTAYGIDFALSGDASGAGMAAAGMGAMSMDVKMSVDEQDKVAGTITVDVSGMSKGSFDLTGGYTRGGAAPVTEPPAGAKIQSFEEAAGSLVGVPAGL